MTTASLNDLELADEVPAAEVLVVRRQLVGDRRHAVIPIPGRAGSWIYPEEAGDRLLDLVVDIRADTFAARRSAVTALAYWCDVGAVSKLIVDDEPDRFHEAILDDAPNTEEWLNNALIPLRFRTGPYALSTTVTTESLSITANPGGGTFASTDLVTARPIIEVTASGGGVSALDVTLNGDTLSWSGPTITDGNTLTISTVSDTVTRGTNADTELTGAYDVANVDMADVSGAFPFIVAGVNAYQFGWSGDATALTVSVRWRERFR